MPVSCDVALLLGRDRFCLHAAVDGVASLQLCELGQRSKFVARIKDSSLQVGNKQFAYFASDLQKCCCKHHLELLFPIVFSFDLVSPHRASW